MSRCVIPIASLLLLVFVSSNLSYIVPSNNDDGSRSAAQDGNKITTCNTDVCKASAKLLLDAMDPSVDPCQDFYQFACGKWGDHNQRPATDSYWSYDDIKVEKINKEISKFLSSNTDETNLELPFKHAQDFYAACMNKENREKPGLTPLVELLNSFGGWPMTMENWDSTNFNWQKTIAYITRIQYSGILLSIFNDLENSNQTRIKIDQGNSILERDQLINQEKEKTFVDAYQLYIKGAANEIKKSLNSNAKDIQIDNDVNDMLIFEKELAEITSPGENRRNYSRMYNLKTLTQLQTFTDEIDTTSQPQAKINWLELLRNIYKPGANIHIEDSEVVIVAELDYLKKLVALLVKTPLRTIANYVHWRIVYQLASKTNEKMGDLKFQFIRIIQGVKESYSMDVKCTEEAKYFFGFAISKKYVDSVHFTATVKEEVKTIVNNVKAQFKKLMNNNNWMDSKTKEKALEKLNHMATFLGHNEWIMDPTKLKEYYSGLSLSREDYFSNYKSAYEFSNTKTFIMLRKLNDPDHYWGLHAFSSNAGYSHNENYFAFPAAYLQYPSFLSGRPLSLNYGALGAVIGHEITHGFDDQGSQFDKNGNLQSWWEPETKTKFDERAKCFIDQYNEYTILNETRVNGLKCQSESISDDGGIRQAFHAYKDLNIVEEKLPGLEKYTSEQLFFLSFANRWCSTATDEFLKGFIDTNYVPDKLRVIGPLSNNEEFVHHFSCSVESAMNRRKKCSLW